MEHLELLKKFLLLKGHSKFGFEATINRLGIYLKGAGFNNELLANLDRNKLKQAEIICNRLLNELPKDASDEVYTLYGFVLLKQGRHEEAISIFESMLAKDPSNSLSAHGLSCALLNRWELERPGNIYVITALKFNHIDRKIPIDHRFIAPRMHRFYSVDETLYKMNFPMIYEIDFGDEIFNFGKNHMREWSFLINEYRNKFVDYPFYMISSRFYEKNKRLEQDLTSQWGHIFDGLSLYGYGNLPSYDRDLIFGDGKNDFRHVTKLGKKLINDVLGFDLMGDDSVVSDFSCNYIGFYQRRNLEEYVEFYLPLINYFFDNKLNLRRGYDQFVGRNSVYRNEAPLTYLFEICSRAYFAKTKKRFFGLHYLSSYEIDEAASTAKVLFGKNKGAIFRASDQILNGSFGQYRPAIKVSDS